MPLELIYFIILIILTLLTPLFLPTALLVSITTLIYGFHSNFELITPRQVISFVIIGVFATFLDELLAFFGIKKLGGSKYSVAGALIGCIIFFVFTGVGAILGLLLGAFLGELIFAKSSVEGSLKAALGAVVGMLSGLLVKFILALLLTVWFAVLVF
jgi:uncharacterized protein YqgC (DUF456 family)